jgi:hypothetical protein
MPGEPLTTTQHSDSPAGKIALKTFTVKSAGGQVSYMVAYNDYPARMLRSVKPNDILTRVVRGALRDEDTVESQKSLTLKQHPGRDLRAKIKNGLLYDSRFFLVGSRLYQISIVSEPQAVRPEDRARFFNSFRLIDKQ